MTTRSPQTALAEWLQEIWREGLVLTDEVARFMDATFGSDDLATVLAESDDGEIDSLIELLCYPGKNIQIRYETRWGDQCFNPDDLSAVVAELSAADLKATVLSPSGSHLCSIELPTFALEAFVRRLNITWIPPQRLAEAVKRHHAGRRGMDIRVRLRNARICWDDNQTGFMELFLSKLPGEGDAFDACLDLLLSILWELKPGTAPHDFLIAKKFFYFKSLCRAEDFERKRLASNMETLMLQGARAAHGSIELWRHNMRLIDLICQALYGRTHFFQQPGDHCVDLTDMRDSRQIEDVIRLLS